MGDEEWEVWGGKEDGDAVKLHVGEERRGGEAEVGEPVSEQGEVGGITEENKHVEGVKRWTKKDFIRLI